MHLAVASRVPTVGMFCVTDASVYAPYGLGNFSLHTQGKSARDAAAEVVRAAFPDLLTEGGAAGGGSAGLTITRDAAVDHPDNLGHLGLSH
jgi:hypothetical protein